MAHVNIGKVFSAPYKAMGEFSARALETIVDIGFAPSFVEVLKIRTSQLNGCAFCLRSHTADAIKLGESAERLAVLAAWWESQYFTDAERAALQIVEEVTLISDHAVSTDRGIDASAHLSDEQIAAVTWVAIALNAWNRIAVCSHYPVGPKRS